MYYFYQLKGSILVSNQEHPELHAISQQQASTAQQRIYWLVKRNPLRSHVCACIMEPWHLFLEEESLALLNKEIDLLPSQEEQLKNLEAEIPWILDRINSKHAYTLNTNHPRWKERLDDPLIKGSRINIAGLGDVGGTLLTGLRMQPIGKINSIGIFDLSRDKMNRWEQEANQIASMNYDQHPPVHMISENQLFDCDIFLFCIAKQIPELGTDVSDVRMAQLETNANIVKIYAQKARSAKFKGLFAVISDPVDQLCKIAYESSNYNEAGEIDLEGLFPEQVKGFGLGVMNARANYYAIKHENSRHYLKEGRAFGPHGAGLFILNSLINYNEKISSDLTQKTLTANLSVRKTGYKPFVAPALSSGCFSILAAITGEEQYSTTFMGGVYFGSRNWLQPFGPAWETYKLPKPVAETLQNTWRKLDQTK